MRSLLWRLLSSPVRHPGRWAGLLLLAAVLAVSGRLADEIRRGRPQSESIEAACALAS